MITLIISLILLFVVSLMVFECIKESILDKFYPITIEEIKQFITCYGNIKYIDSSTLTLRQIKFITHSIKMKDINI